MKRPMTRGERWTYAIACVLILGLFSIELLIDFAPAKLGGFFFVLAWPPLLALHEAGHAVAARLCGQHVSAVVVGFGAVLWAGSVRGVDVEIRLAPVEGFTSYSGPRRSRLQGALIAFAGPGAELLLAAALVAIVGADQMFARSELPAVIAAQSVAVAAVVGAVVNLIPMDVQKDHHPDSPRIANDGRAIILSLLGRR